MRWNLWDLMNPVVLPTLASGLMVAIATSIPISNTTVKFAVQPLVVVMGYLTVVSVASKGQIPRMLLDVSRRTLNAKT